MIQKDNPAGHCLVVKHLIPMKFFKIILDYETGDVHTTHNF